MKQEVVKEVVEVVAEVIVKRVEEVEVVSVSKSARGSISISIRFVEVVVEVGV